MYKLNKDIYIFKDYLGGYLLQNNIFIEVNSDMYLLLKNIEKVDIYQNQNIIEIINTLISKNIIIEY
ncbi:hypothetical protein [Mammaliicoccus sciuri]|uniref:hypothetical protein n=1 Tax=Mammaliicoccus sciuri TaxID=1296 RepID=UPI0034DD096B